MMHTNVGSLSYPARSLRGAGDVEAGFAPLDLSAHGLSRRVEVLAENHDEIRGILERHFEGVAFNNLTAPLTGDQINAAEQLKDLGAFNIHTLTGILGQSATLELDAGARISAERTNSEYSGSRHPSEDEGQSANTSVDLDRAERGDSPPNLVSPGDGDARTGGGAGFFAHIAAAGRTIGKALPRATPAVIDAVCLGLSVPIAGLAIKQAIEESHMEAHDPTRLFMKATLPTVVALNSLRNIIKYGTDGRQV